MYITKNKIYGIIIFSIIIRLIWMSFNQSIVEEAYYWNYAMHLDVGYLDHPPMVALMIAIFRFLLGDHEWAIRIPAILCWSGTAYYSYRLSEVMKAGTGKIAVLLVSILPFFFLQSMFMTPDLPLMLFWSATLYYCYRAIILNEKKCFYLAAIGLGLGLLSKYTMFLLVPATLLLITIAPQYRFWWKTKELYCGALIAIILFSPVMYWNATHDWASFVFQSTQRMQNTREFSTHIFFLYSLFFIMPIGLWGLMALLKRSYAHDKQLFIKVYTLLPLCVFAIFSLKHQIKFNWLGPLFLALIPWLADLFYEKQYPERLLHLLWGLLPAYMLTMGVMITSQPSFLYQKIFLKYFDWQGMTISLNQIARNYEKEAGQEPTFLAFDKYNMLSEIAFYQQKAFTRHWIDKIYPVLGQHVFNYPSLMYRYWDNKAHHHGEKVILLSWNEFYLTSNEYNRFLKKDSNIQVLWTKDPKQQFQLIPLYYQMATLL